MPENSLSRIDGERTIVTSALPYIHGLPHLGNLVGSILPADLYHRYLDLRGHENIFICGSDEHGTPLELAAIEAGETPKEHADEQHAKVKNVLERFDIDFSLYGRTHTPYNEERTHDIFIQLYRNGYIVEKEQELPYCLECARFLPDRYIEGECPHCGGLARGDQCDDCGKLLEPEEIIDPHCTICEKTEIEFRTTKNLFLQLSKFEDVLKEWLQDNDPIPDTEKQAVLNLIDDGLEDRCITRDIEWGFPVPWKELGLDEVYKDKVLYVWFDAPIGYIGITQQYFDAQEDEDEWKTYWQDSSSRTLYSIGKDNTIFHSIIFPSMLIGGAEEGQQYNLPTYEFIHEYLLSQDVQFSKSRGHGLTSEDALDLLPADYWRFYLAMVIPENHDTTFSWDDFESKINGELNDTVGNFVNRVLTLTDQWFDGTVPAPDNPATYNETLQSLHNLITQYDTQFEQEKSPRQALHVAVKVARLGDELLSREEPWNNEPVRKDVIYTALRIIEVLATLLYPFTPQASARTWEMLNIDADITDESDRLAFLAAGETFLEPGHQLGERTILFDKVDATELAATVDQEDENDTMTDTVSFDTFQQLDIRTGVIESVEDHPNADKLYVVKVRIGDEVRQSVAGLKTHFSADELVGKDVVVLTNLEPAELRGKTSEVMMLAAEHDDQVTLLTPEDDIPAGATVK